jgi:5-methyltetrahydrofolate--homocysteine methyltransferase
MAVTAERKLEVARRSCAILVEETGVAEDIWFDPLVFPCGTGDEQYIGSAAATIEGCALSSSELPAKHDPRHLERLVRPAAGGREVLNSVFLFHCTQAGLDAAIVNTEKAGALRRDPRRGAALARRCFELAPGDVGGLGGGDRALHRPLPRQGRRLQRTSRLAELPLEERLARAVVEGTKEGLIEDLDAALADPRWPARSTSSTAR